MNKILVTCFVCIAFCWNAFSLQYNIRIINRSDNVVTVTKQAGRNITISDNRGNTYSFPTKKELELQTGEVVTIVIDARPYNENDSKQDFVNLSSGKINAKCFFIPVRGDTYVYPFIECLSDDCELQRDVCGAGYTLTIGKQSNGKQNNNEILADALRQQGAMMLPQQEYSSSSDYDGIF